MSTEQSGATFDFRLFMNEPAIIIVPKSTPSNADMLNVKSLIKQVLDYVNKQQKILINFDVSIGDANPPRECTGIETGEHLLSEMFSVSDGLGNLVCEYCGARFFKKSNYTTYEHGKELFRKAIQKK